MLHKFVASAGNRPLRPLVVVPTKHVDSIGADRIVRDGLGRGTNRDYTVCEDERLKGRVQVTRRWAGRICAKSVGC